jgi:hypothetical protein
MKNSPDCSGKHAYAIGGADLQRKAGQVMMGAFRWASKRFKKNAISSLYATYSNTMNTTAWSILYLNDE